jgi:hypothetical protein
VLEIHSTSCTIWGFTDSSYCDITNNLGSGGGKTFFAKSEMVAIKKRMSSTPTLEQYLYIDTSFGPALFSLENTFKL